MPSAATSSSATSPPAARRATFATRIVILFVLLCIVQVGICLGVWASANNFSRHADGVALSHEIRERAQAVIARMQETAASAAAYVANGETRRIADYERFAPLIGKEVAAVEKLVRDDPQQSARVRELHERVEERLRLLDAAIASRDRGEPRFPAEGPTALLGVVQAILDAEDAMLIEHRLDGARNATHMQWLTLTAGIASLVVLSLMLGLILREQRRRARGQAHLRDAFTRLEASLAETRRMGETMRHLAEFGEMLQGCRSTDELREGVSRALPILLPTHGGRLALINPSQNLAAIGAHWGRHRLLADSVFAPEDCWALRRGQPYPLLDAISGFSCKHVHWPDQEAPQAAYLCVPLVAQGDTIGVLTLDGDAAPDENERRLAIAIGEQLSLALANLRLQETLRTQSIRDPLTGLFNRRYLEASLEHELLRAQRRALPLSVLMLDMDHFKRFNDAYGHEAGDALLRQFAELLSRVIRREDIACRYGGEEFTLILPEAGPAQAFARAEQIRTAVAEMAVEYREQRLGQITLSIGAASFPDDGAASKELLRRADTALYRAKSEGRNRTVAASREAPSTAEASTAA